METSFVNNASQPPQNFAFPCPLSERMSGTALPEGKADIWISILGMGEVASVTRRAGHAGKVPLLLPSYLSGGGLLPSSKSCADLSPLLGSRVQRTHGSSLPIPAPTPLKGACPSFRVSSVG